MATYQTQKVVGDLGSQEHAQLVNSYNELLDALGTLITGLKTAADVAAIQALATAAETSLEANVKKLQQSPNLPLSPADSAV
jgi:hypothetical protein